jgi:hypothetical protein
MSEPANDNELPLNAGSGPMNDVPRGTATDVALAFLMLDGEPRASCVACCLRLEAGGMVRRLVDQPMTMVPDARLVIFEIEAPYTLADCKDAVTGRHMGPAC